MPAKLAARQLTLTALVARRRPALLSLPGFTAGAEFVLSGVTPASATRAPGRGPVAAVVPIAPEQAPFGSPHLDRPQTDGLNRPNLPTHLQNHCRPFPRLRCRRPATVSKARRRP